MILEGVDRYRIVDPWCEGVRVVLSYRGEPYSAKYVQGISGVAFRIAGICPCAPTCSSAMEPEALARLMGYETEHVPLGGEGRVPMDELPHMVKRIMDEIRSGRPAVVWHAFTNAEWDVVCGFDEEQQVFVGRGSYVGLEEYATADSGRAATCGSICDPLGALLIGEKTGALDARSAEIGALREAVRHAHTVESKPMGGEGWHFLEGLAAYDRWVEDFKSPDRARTIGDAYCFGVYRSTHRAAATFLTEIAPKYAEASASLRRASESFTREADALDRGQDLLWWNSPMGADAVRNARATAVLAEARDAYSEAIDHVEAALKSIGN